MFDKMISDAIQEKGEKFIDKKFGNGDGKLDDEIALAKTSIGKVSAGAKEALGALNATVLITHAQTVITVGSAIAAAVTPHLEPLSKAAGSLFKTVDLEKLVPALKLIATGVGELILMGKNAVEKQNKAAAPLKDAPKKKGK